MAVGQVITPIEQDWTRPADWIDISSVGNNEINLLVSDGYMAFTVFTVSGTYSIDWGDGVIETGRASGTVYQHQYVLGSGTSTSYGYTIYKIRIYGASTDITRFQVANPVITNATQSRSIPLLWLVMGTNGLTSIQYLAGQTNSVYCPALQSVTLPPVLTGITRMDTAFISATSLQQVIGLESAWGAVTTTQQMFDSCVAIKRVNLPPTLPNTITSFNGMFISCNSLTTVNLPTSWPTSLTDLSTMFSSCFSLKTITLPSAWPTGLTTTANMFQNCQNLQSINLPTSGFPNTVTTMSQMFASCFSLTSLDFGTNWGTGTTIANLVVAGCRALQKVTFPSNQSNITNGQAIFQGAAPNTSVLQQINNLNKIGSLTVDTDLSSMVSSNLYYTGSVNIGAKLSRFFWQGGGTTSKNATTDIRLTNTGSLFNGTSPQITTTYLNMETGSLQTMFSDIANTAASGSVRTIQITGTNGTTGNTTNSMTFTSGSNIVNTTSGNVILPGFELTTASTGTPPMNWMNVIFDIANDLVIPNNGTINTGNNIPNGKVVYFTALNNSSLSIYKPYYVINSNATNFQISLTPGGSAFDITGATGGTNTLGWTANVVSYSGFSMTMDSVARVSTSVSATVSPLKRIDLLARGWTITG
jgi:hypothetical protein